MEQCQQEGVEGHNFQTEDDPSAVAIGELELPAGVAVTGDLSTVLQTLGVHRCRFVGPERIFSALWWSVSWNITSAL